MDYKRIGIKCGNNLNGSGSAATESSAATLREAIRPGDEDIR